MTPSGVSVENQVYDPAVNITTADVIVKLGTGVLSMAFTNTEANRHQRRAHRHHERAPNRPVTLATARRYSPTNFWIHSRRSAPSVS